MRLTPRTLTLMLACTFAGCSNETSPVARDSDRNDSRNFVSRRYQAPEDQVKGVAERVFRSHFRFDADASTDTRLISRPTEIEGRGEAHNVRDRVRLAPARRRQLAELRLMNQGDMTTIQISVRAQRLETAELASFAREMGDDRPNALTPLNRSGPASVDTREEWVNAGRDTKTEQDVLNEIQSSLNASSKPAP